MKKLIAGNWKMNGTNAFARSLTEAVASGIGNEPGLLDRCDFLICPPYPYLHTVKSVIDHNHGAIDLGGQDCAVMENGAYTGDVSAEMLADMGCRFVILGHSERRDYHRESNALVRSKAALAHAKGVRTIICVGETEQQRESGQEQSVVSRQLAESLPDGSNAQNTIIAYEPVWAIGTGRTATTEDVAAMHQFIRDNLKERLEDYADMRILYGGSVKPENAGALFEVDHVNGALIGGASLKADQFLGIARAAKA